MAVPNIRELSTIVEVQCISPAINLDRFPNDETGVNTWSGTPRAYCCPEDDGTDSAWKVSFENGQLGYVWRESIGTVRLVRGGL
ncbi:MAG: DUF1566 domain-containing protein [Candidatus Electrothrix sp. ATG1]|nr:DUF1566 domain-containing protein [Candidatus Electrothrix sp. ATG1]